MQLIKTAMLDDIKKKMQAPIEEAVGLPYASYTDSEVFDLETREIFHKDWFFVCNITELKNTGDQYAFDIAGEPVVIIHGRDGELRALSNSCSHRGTILADEGFGNSNKFVCPYHAWTFTDKGKLVGVSYPGNIEVDRNEHCLPQFKLEIWNGLIFVNISGTAEPLAERYAGMQRYFDRFGIGDYENGFGGEYEYWDSNWKLIMENAMESYHLFKVHKPTLETVTPTKGALYLEGHGDWSITIGENVPVSEYMGGGMTGSLAEKIMNGLSSKRDKAIADHYMLVSLPPNFVGIATAESFAYLSVLPDASGKSRVRAGGISKGVFNPSKGEPKFVEDFFAEDKFICERAQKSMRTRFNKAGKLVELERIIVDFHQYIGKRLFGNTPLSRYKAPEADAFVNCELENKLADRK